MRRLEGSVVVRHPLRGGGDDALQVPSVDDPLMPAEDHTMSCDHVPSTAHDDLTVAPVRLQRIGDPGSLFRENRILDLPEMAEAPEFLTNADRLGNREEMTRRLTERTLQRDRAELLAACEAEGVPAGPINDLADVFADPHVQARGMQIELDGVPGVRSPFRFSDASVAMDRPAPKLGEGD